MQVTVIFHEIQLALKKLNNTICRREGFEMVDKSKFSCQCPVTLVTFVAACLMRILLFLFTLEQRGSIIPWALLDFDRLTVTEPEYIEKTLRNSLSYENIQQFCTNLQALFRSTASTECSGGMLTLARPVFLLQCYRLSLFNATSTALPKVLFWWSIPWIAGNWLLAGSSREATRQCHTWAGFSLTWFARGWSVKHFNRSLTDE